MAEEIVVVAPKLRPIAEIIADLSKEIPAQYLQVKPKGAGLNITYWQWQFGVMAFNKYAPGWSWQIDGTGINDGHVSVFGRIFIPCAENGYPGLFRAGTGGDYENADEAKRAKGFDPLLDAERQAMKRAMSLWGLGLYLYPLK